MIAKYYEILGVTGQATLNDIKKAFRIRAKQLHPDANKNPNANQQFILLLEAYEYLVNRKTGKVYEEDSVTTRRYSTHQRWQDNEAERARHRAEYYSKGNYKNFSDSEYYKAITSLETIFGYISFFLSIAIFVFVPLILTLIYGTTGLRISFLVTIITSPFTIGAIRSRPPLKMRDILNAGALAAKSRIARFTALSILNIFIIVKIGFQTLVPLAVLLFVFWFTAMIVFFITFSVLKKTGTSSSIISFCYCPFVLNLLLAINFIFSSNPVFETYSFVHRERWYGYGEPGSQQGQWEKIAAIDLENNTYSSFTGIRMFVDFKAMKDAEKITYKFEDGLLGFRVMKSFKFE